jgi:hypothetical protein
MSDTILMNKPHSINNLLNQTPTYRSLKSPLDPDILRQSIPSRILHNNNSSCVIFLILYAYFRIFVMLDYFYYILMFEFC